MTKLERAKKLAEALESTAESLTSHLEFTYKKGNCTRRQCRKQLGDKQFHRKNVREYAEVLLTLARELERL